MDFKSINGSPFEGIKPVSPEIEEVKNFMPNFNGSVTNAGLDLEMATKLACRVEAIERQSMMRSASLTTELIQTTTEMMDKMRMDDSDGIEQFPLTDSIRYILSSMHTLLLANPMRAGAVAQGLAENPTFTGYLETIYGAADGEAGPTDEETKKAVYSTALMLCQLIAGEIMQFRDSGEESIDRNDFQSFVKTELLPLLSDEVISPKVRKEFLTGEDGQPVAGATGGAGLQNIHAIFLALHNLLTIAAECVVVDPKNSGNMGKSRAAINGGGSLRSGLLSDPNTDPTNAEDEESDFEADSFL